MPQVPKKLFGNPQNLELSDRSLIHHPLDSYVQRIRDENALYGVALENVYTEQVFLSCEELLGLEAFLANHHAWLEEFAALNRETLKNTGEGRVSLFLRRKSDHTKRIMLCLETHNSLAWYGTAVSVRSEESEPLRTENETEEYLRSEWEEDEEGTRYSSLCSPGQR